MCLLSITNPLTRHSRSRTTDGDYPNLATHQTQPTSPKILAYALSILTRISSLTATSSNG